MKNVNLLYHWTYQLIQKELNIEFAAICKVIHDELCMRKLVYRWVPYDLTEYQIEACARISKQSLRLFNSRRHCLITKIITGDEAYKPFFEVPKY